MGIKHLLDSFLQFITGALGPTTHNSSTSACHGGVDFQDSKEFFRRPSGLAEKRHQVRSPYLKRPHRNMSAVAARSLQSGQDDLETT